jgi:energy-coupling factor transport system permease protein
MMSVLPDKMLIYSLEWLLSPLKKVGFPVRDILMIGIMAYEFVPVVSEELRFVMKSKELLIYPRRRLLHPEILSMKIIIPLFSRSFERVEKLAKGIHIDNSIGAMKLKDYIVIVLSGMIFIWIVFFVS